MSKIKQILSDINHDSYQLTYEASGRKTAKVKGHYTAYLVKTEKSIDYAFVVDSSDSIVVSFVDDQGIPHQFEGAGYELQSFCDGIHGVIYSEEKGTHSFK